MSTAVTKVDESREVSAPCQSTSLIRVIERAATNPDVDIEKMERLLAMHERIVGKQAENAFNAAMSQAQSEMGRISADALNPQTKSRYATYGKLDKALRPLYTTNGFALSFGTEDSPTSEYLRVTCHVSHRDGHSRGHHIDMPADGKGAKGGDVMTKTHATGAAASYGMRYLLKMIFNVAIGEEDADGNQPQNTITQDQQDALDAIITEVGANKAKFLAYMGAPGGLAYIPEKDYARAVQALEAKRGQA